MLAGLELPADQQQQALSACFKEAYNGGQNPVRILLPVRNLQFWIETNVLLILKDAPFDKRDAQLVSTVGSCADCPKRTGHNKLLFGDDLGKQGDRCTDPHCFNAKLSAHVAKAVAAKPSLVQISTAYGGQKEGSPVLPRNKYTAIRDDKPQKKEDAQRPEFKVCKYAADAIITEGSDIGTIHKVCANLDCLIHHASKQRPATDAAFKAEQENRRREETIAQATGLCVLKATSDAVPVRLMKRDLLFVTERLAAVLDERRLAIIFRLHGIGKASTAGDAPAKLLASFLRKADESTLGRVLVAITVLQTAHSPNQSTKALREAAEFYKVDVAAITATIKQEFAAKDKAQAARKEAGKAKPTQPHSAVKKAKAA